MKKNTLKRFMASAMTAVMCVSSLGTLAVNAAPADPAAETSVVDNLMSKMTLRQKIAQMMMPDFRKWQTESDSGQKNFQVMNDEVAQIIKDYDFGGVILFAENVAQTDQTLKLTTDLQEAATGGTDGSNIPLLLTIDQEGGIVYRLGSGTALPGNMALGATRSTDAATQSGEVIGRELSALGINVDFAPVADVNSNPSNPVIGLRSYGSDPELVGSMATAAMKGMQKYNIATAAKHFPGHGDTATDSHTGLPCVDKSLDELRQCELVPFQKMIDNGVDMLMTAHIQYPQVEKETAISKKDGSEISLPATLSKTILTDLVRNEMHYDGIIVTDALNMDAISQNFGETDACIRAIKAGVDICLMPTILRSKADISKMDAILDGVEAAVNSGEISVDRINESVKRILSLKEKRGILNYTSDTRTYEEKLAVANEQVGSEQNRDIERNISAQAVTVIKNNDNILPLKPQAGQKVLLLGAYNNETPGLALGMRRVIADHIISGKVDYETFRYTSANLDQVKQKIDDADYVIVISEVSTNFSNWLTTQPTAITEYAKAQGKKSIVMSISKPYDVANYADSDAIVAVYGNKGMDPTEALKPDNAFGPNIIAGVEVIFGRFAASGKLPVNVPVIENGQMTSDIKYAFGYGLTYDAVEPSSYYAVENSLLNFYNTWKDADLSVYTADSAAALKSALTAAKAVLDKSNASITEMDSAVSALVDAVNNLAYGVQKTHLNVAIDAADKLLERAADYENTEDLTAALTAAKAVYANTSATQTEVDRAASTLLDALAAMAERADLAALKKLVASAGGLEEKDFTSDSYKDLKDAMDAAKDVIDDLNRTPEAIGKAYADIITAITNLERVGNKAALVAVIAKAEAIVAAKDSYVSSTLNGLEEALAAGKAVNDNPDALQDAINNAVTLLTEKVANVRLLGDVNNDGSVTTDDSALLLRSAAELDTLDDAATVSADMNQDGIADTSDAVLILQTAAEF